MKSTNTYLIPFIGLKIGKHHFEYEIEKKFFDVFGFDEFEKVWNERAPLQWDVSDPVPAAQGAVALLSDWFSKTTGEIIHVDGGVHAMGA